MYGTLRLLAAPVIPFEGILVQQVASYLRERTTPEDRILMVGLDSGVYFLADRDSPTRYHYSVWHICGRATSKSGF